MEPQLPKPQFSPEVAPSEQPMKRSGEIFVAPKPSEAISPVEQGKETHEVATDGPKGDPAAIVQQFSPPPLPTIDPIQDASSGSAQDDTGVPAAAADDDLIEKEWVEKAKQVVAETRDDPHAQDVAVGKLQAEYLKKRYGKIISLPKEE